MPKEDMEIQAETVAYVIARHFNIETKSFNYLALYSGDYKKIMESMKTISEITSGILREIKP